MFASDAVGLESLMTPTSTAQCAAHVIPRVTIGCTVHTQSLLTSYGQIQIAIQFKSRLNDIGRFDLRNKDLI